MTKNKFKISKDWGFEKSIEEIIADASFVFSHNGTKGERPHIVIKTPINGINVIIIDYNNDGICVQAVSAMGKQYATIINDISEEIEKFIEDYLKKTGVEEYLCE